MQTFAGQSFAHELADSGGFDLAVSSARHALAADFDPLPVEILHAGQSGALNDVQKRQISIIYSAALGLVGMSGDMIEMARGVIASCGSRVHFCKRDPFERSISCARPRRKRLGCTSGTARAAASNGPLSVLLNLDERPQVHGGQACRDRALAGWRPRRVCRARYGAGISDEALETLYQPFRRQPTRATGYYFSGPVSVSQSPPTGQAMGSMKLETPGLGYATFVLDLPAAPVYSRCVVSAASTVVVAATQSLSTTSVSSANPLLQRLAPHRVVPAPAWALPSHAAVASVPFTAIWK